MIGIPKDLKDALSRLDVASGMHVIQFGAQRRGHVAHMIAQKVGEKGRVSIVDVIPDELHAMHTFFAAQKMHWVDVVHGDFVEKDGVPMPAHSADRIVVVHTAWRHPRHEDVLAEARRLLKPGGKILFLDWQKNTRDPLGSRVNGHLDVLEAQRLCIQSGCERVERILNNERHWGFVMSFAE
jgi:ubiquinone/menaquinone biosynthesis C-methylase UbiE